MAEVVDKKLDETDSHMFALMEHMYQNVLADSGGEEDPNPNLKPLFFLLNPNPNQPTLYTLYPNPNQPTPYTLYPNPNQPTPYTLYPNPNPNVRTQKQVHKPSSSQENQAQENHSRLEKRSTF